MDGTSWSIVASPNAANPTGTANGYLGAVSCPTATTCFAVGYANVNETWRTLIEQWNGTAWSIVTSPNPSGAASTQLAGVSCVSAASCFAVGTYSTYVADWTLVERYA